MSARLAEQFAQFERPIADENEVVAAKADLAGLEDASGGRGALVLVVKTFNRWNWRDRASPSSTELA